MRIRVYSDLHLEFGPSDPPPSNDVDVVVLAGDLDGTRVLSNSRGYVGEWLDGFKPNISLEVGR
jgi:hypothetical protein